ncbi:unnamed protein product [marine sediment metagenome]|uniref:Uncharacterized protein n=1 Tax=marine sediment metagenome TaxID=412755 RepID=X1FBG5_9ZZZZ
MDLEDLVIKVYKGKHPEHDEEVLFVKWEGTIDGELHGHRAWIRWNEPTSWDIIQRIKEYVEHLEKYYRTSKGV